jgi:hypothetical protein
MKLTKASVSDTDFAIFGSHIATQTEKHDLDKEQQFKILLESTRQSYRNEIRNLHSKAKLDQNNIDNLQNEITQFKSEI